MFGPSRRVARRTARRTSRRQMAMYGGGGDEYYDEPAAAPAAAAPAEPDYAEELKKLAELKAAGVISEEEFDAKKKQILGI
jgi:Short C-terminal domain